MDKYVYVSQETLIHLEMFMRKRATQLVKLHCDDYYLREICVFHVDMPICSQLRKERERESMQIAKHTV